LLCQIGLLVQIDSPIFDYLSSFIKDTVDRVKITADTLLEDNDMSQTHIEKFYEIAANDQALLGQLISDTSSPEDFVENAVAAAKERGLNFSAEEANTWIAAQQATKANDELSDTQLEGVAGGKGFSGAIDSALEPVLRPVMDPITDSVMLPAGDWSRTAVNNAGNWFSSW
jgi:predicted ribosomally synthesized peptide with nif11-like leader